MPIMIYSHVDKKKIEQLRQEIAFKNLCHDFAYDPNQPRDPKGSETGGEWVKQVTPGGRAAGGVKTIGINDAQYRGGQFLPSSEQGKFYRAREKQQKEYLEKKQEVSPYKWEKPPAINQRTIFPQIAGIFKYDKESDTFIIDSISQATKEYLGKSYNKKIEWIKLYNSGLRWYEDNTMRHLLDYKEK